MPMAMYGGVLLPPPLLFDSRNVHPQHHVNWHSDSETDLVDESSIASLSLGQTYVVLFGSEFLRLTARRRTFQLRANEDAHFGTQQSVLQASKKPAADYTDDEKKLASYKVGTDPNLNMQLVVKHGDLIIMGGTLQKTWRHRVPKETEEIGPRICFTFRTVAKDL